MVSDKETNWIYISDLLEKKAPIAYGELLRWFTKLDIKFAILPDTKDLWVVDFMPLQVRKDYFLQFIYDPDYLKFKKYEPTKSDPKKVFDGIGITANHTNIVLDGCNVVKSKNKVILTTKIFKENPNYPEKDLINEIKRLLQVEKVIVIPQEPGDFVGHSDGMVRFIDENTVLVNQYPTDKKYKDFACNFRSCLRNAGLEIIEFPYTSWQNKSANDATSCYINFLEVGKYIFCPTFDDAADQVALKLLQTLFRGREIISIDSRDLAVQGGVLNCATWNILHG